MIRNPVKRQLVILIALFAVMSGTYFTRQPLPLGPGDAGFWQIFAMGMLTGALIVNIVTLVRSRRG